MAYVPYDWQTGETITEERLDYMEQGIAENSKAGVSYRFELKRIYEGGTYSYGLYDTLTETTATYHDLNAYLLELQSSNGCGIASLTNNPMSLLLSYDTDIGGYWINITELRGVDDYGGNGTDVFLYAYYGYCDEGDYLTKPVTGLTQRVLKVATTAI